ncbi:MAG: hypothetical protein JRJ03_00215 [Deltaproteobacteria bacterium]|nr:hypothetical protein [Deltaproteobacteria bacterium]
MERMLPNRLDKIIGYNLALEYSLPETVEETVSWLISDIPLRDKDTIADMEEHELPFLSAALLSVYIQKEYWLGSGNMALIESCCYMAGSNDLDVYHASTIIIKELWKKLEKPQTPPLQVCD